MDNYKIKVNDDAESKEAQELFFKLGYEWYGCGAVYNRIGNYTFITAYPDEMTLRMGWGADTKVETTLPQLRDLVAQSKSKSIEFLEPQDDGTYKLINWTCMSCPPENFIEVPEGAEAYFKYGDGTLFVKFPPDWESSNFCDGEWIESAHWSREDILGDKKGRLLWSRQTIQEQGLISGADALKAMMDGKRVLYSGYGNKDWDTALNCNLGVFLKHEKFPDFSFKIVPRTIKLELEIPAPFEPKVGEEYYYLNSGRDSGYAMKLHDGKQMDFMAIQFGSWRTEEEIKQVVAALRGGIKG